ncbi:MAG: hypothetical protein ABSF60_10460 [Verrucomicrobiota bacterium]
MLEISAGFRQTQLIAKGVKHVEVVFAFYVLIKAHQGNHHQRNAQAAQFAGQKPVREAAKNKGVKRGCLRSGEEQDQCSEAEKCKQGDETGRAVDEIKTVLIQNILQHVADRGGVQQISKKPPATAGYPQGVTQNQADREKVDPRHNPICMLLTPLLMVALLMV